MPDLLNPNVLIPIGVPLLYLALMVVVRWHNIAVPTRRLAYAHLQGLRQRWKQETPAPGQQTAEEQALGERVGQLLEEAERALRPSAWDFLFWPRGAELKAWRLMHEAECLVALGMDRKLAQERLRQLTEGNQPPPPTDPTITREGAQSPAARPSSAPDDVHARLYWALRRYYDQTDTRFARLLTTHAKVAWLLDLGLIFVGLFLALDRFSLFPSPDFRIWMLFGALGATLSRLLRVLKAQDIPTDYGFYWILLFLAPVYGALAGPLAVLLAQFINLFNQQRSAWLVVATLAGFSERYLDRLIEEVEKKQAAPKQSDQSNQKEQPQPANESGNASEGRPPTDEAMRMITIEAEKRRGSPPPPSGK